MVSQNSPSNSSILHQFIVSDTISNQAQFENQQFNVYGSTIRGNSSTFSQPPALLPSIQSLGERMSRSVDLDESEISHTRHLMDLLGASNEANQQARRLSLSLNSHMLVPPDPYRQRSFNTNVLTSYSIPGEEARGTCNPGVMGLSDDYSFSGSPFANAIGNSRYLKAAQSLLEEIVNVHGKDNDFSYEDYGGRSSVAGRRALGLSSELKAELCNNGFIENEKQEIHIKIAKLVALLEEVENRYGSYHHQLEEVASSFEVIAGLGSAKCYTSLALQAMSRHFYCLSDAIMSQIKLNRRKLSHDSPKLSAGLSQLNLFDQEGRHSRMSLQQLGLIQSQRQAWRPVRGLPDTSVAILRAWLFEHFLHPYPTDSEKLMLASQTGLTKNQVSNWFINARVRLWKPMIEEMYKEEFADSSDSDPLLAGGSMTGENNPEYVEE